MLLSATFAFGQVTKWQDIYKVKKKDTLFGIAQKYGVSMQDLMDANPEMKEVGYKLKKGETIFIPFATKAATTTTTAATPKPSAKVDDIRTRAIRVGVMLPLHNVDGDGRRMVEYYRGLLLACDALRGEMSVDISAWNVNADADIRQTLLAEGASKCDIVFGPLYSSQVKPLADFCKTYGIKMVIPFSINGDEVKRNGQIYQVYQSGEMLTERAIKAFVERFPNHHPIFIDCNDTTSRKGVFTFGLRKQLEAKGIKYSITNLKSSEEQFSKAFSRKQANVVILNTGRSPELNVAFAKLNGLATTNPNLKIAMYGYTEWLMYAKYDLENFHKFDTYIPTTFYYNALSPATQRIEKAYRSWFKADMQSALPRFALTGYDHAMYFLKGLHKHGAKFTGARGTVAYTPVQTPLYFTEYAEGGHQNGNFELIHYKTDQTTESITY